MAVLAAERTTLILLFRGRAGRSLSARRTQLKTKSVRVREREVALGAFEKIIFLSKAINYQISKIKLSISMIAVTPATESTNASLASW
jgi:hypothetical protein